MARVRSLLKFFFQIENQLKSDPFNLLHLSDCHSILGHIELKKNAWFKPVWDQHNVTTLTSPSIEGTYAEYAIICNKVSFLPRQLLTFSCERHSAHLPETKSSSHGSDISPCPLSAWFPGFLQMPSASLVQNWNWAIIPHESTCSGLP